MTTHAAMAVPRQPFSPLNSPRLQHLTNSKNRQNGISTSPLADLKPALTPSAPAKIVSVSLNPSSKRRLPASESDDCDSENVDPSSFSSPGSNKRSKLTARTPSSKGLSTSFSLMSTPTTTSTPTPTFSLASAGSSASSTMMPPSAVPSRVIRTPSSPSRNAALHSKRANMSSPRAPLTAPAGRSPTRARRIGDARSRRVSAPFTRVDPPSFSITPAAGSSALPFSLDAALAGTVSTPISKVSSAPPSVCAPRSAKAKTIEESMPSNWFFEIYEDSPEEEAANLMEHSTLTLDLSSDDENSLKQKERKDQGKENVAPEEDAFSSVSASTSRVASVQRAKKDLLRRKVVKPDDMDDGERSPLSDLETEDFFAAGLSKDSCVVVPATGETIASDSATIAATVPGEEGEAAAKPALFAAEEVVADSEAHQEEVVEVPVVDASGDVEGSILIWEDEDAAAVADSVLA